METAGLKKITPTVIKEREDEFFNALSIMKENHLYIDLVSFPEPEQHIYKSAKEVIKENILRFSFSDSNSFENASDSGLLDFEQIRTKIKRKNEKTLKRQQRFENIDWQYNRLSDLARLVNNIFASEKKKTLNFDTLVDKLVFVKKMNNDTVASDIIKLINESKGWLSSKNGWVKIDIEKYRFSVDETTKAM